MVTASMVQSLTETVINAKHVSMACAVINNGKPTGNTFPHGECRMSILTKTSRRRPASKATPICRGM